ncbi:MAG TPA: iron-containing alcohol dehydrogenase [Negativicutes bacterium]|nr:iron-containing alcohol dehydrogenase [Negativicutes bacterium]
MADFVFRMLTRVMYGRGAVNRLGEECRKLGAAKVLLVADSYMVRNSPAFPLVEKVLKDAGMTVEVFADIEADPSVETVDKGAALMREWQGDMVVALGGGSPMDAAKSICMLRTNPGSIREYMRKERTIVTAAIPLICIPTTAGTGSEVTAGAVTTDKQAGEKIGVSHDSMMARLAIIDPELHASMPPALTASTGLDALCHAIEAYISTEAEPISDALCLHAIRLIGENLRKAVANGRDIETRGKMALASLVAGAAFTNVGLGAVHAIAHCLGAMYKVPHGVANAMLLPYVMEFNVMADMAKFREIAIALGENTAGLSLQEAAAKAVEAVRRLNRDVGVPRTLKEVGVTAGDFPTIVENSITYRLLPCNPRTVSEKDIENILQNAMG